MTDVVYCKICGLEIGPFPVAQKDLAAHKKLHDSLDPKNQKSIFGVRTTK